MKKRRNNQPAPTMASGSEPNETSQSETVAGKKPTTIFDRLDETNKERLSKKSVLLSSAKQRLAEAHDLAGDADEVSGQAAESADKAAFQLYQGRTGSLLSAEEVSETLGAIWGFKRKQGEGSVKPGDPQASKTPFGYGAVIRMRVVRAIQAHDYATTGDVSKAKFFVGVDENKVTDIVERMENQDHPQKLSVFSAYDLFQKVKNEGATRVPTAFNPRSIAAICEDLRNDGAAATIAANPALQSAYKEFLSTLQIVGEKAATLADEQDENYESDESESQVAA